VSARELSPEAREKLSRLAKERHARGEFKNDRLKGNPELAKQVGRLGGRGNTRKKTRITKRVAEAAMEEKNALAIIEVFKDAIHPSQPIHIRIKGATAWADIAMQSAKFDLSEEAQQQQQLSRDELIKLLSEKLSNGPAANLIAGQIEEQTGIVDAEVVEEMDADEAA
jgi:hypothetical protein